MNKLSSLLVALSLLFVPACGSSAAGTYELDKGEFKKVMTAMIGANTDPAMVDTMMEKMSGTLELKADATMTMTLNMPPAPTISTTGTWKLVGDAMTLTSKTNGKDDPKTGKYAGGVITLEDDMGGKKVAMVFRKK